MACFLVATAAQATDPLPSPQGPVILTVKGKIEVTNAGDEAQFDFDMLESLGLTEISTRTIWTVGESRFEGPTLAALLDRVGAHGNFIEAEALNDYIARIPISDATSEAPIIAMRQDGETLPVRRRGPLWIIYPYDTGPEFQTDATFARSVWQLRAITVIE